MLALYQQASLMSVHLSKLLARASQQVRQGLECLLVLRPMGSEIAQVAPIMSDTWAQSEAVGTVEAAAPRRCRAVWKKSETAMTGNLLQAS